MSVGPRASYCDAWLDQRRNMGDAVDRQASEREVRRRVSVSVSTSSSGPYSQHQDEKHQGAERGADLGHDLVHQLPVARHRGVVVPKRHAESLFGGRCERGRESEI